MRLAADFRQEAREALRGKWPMAILIGLVAMLLGGSEKGGAEIKFNYDTSAGFSTTFNFAGQKIYSTGCGIDPKWSGLLIGGAIYLIVIALILAAVYFILGSAVGVGYAEYNLRLINQAEGGFDTLFAYLPDWKTTALTRLYKSLYVLVGTLLLVVPGIIMGYTYAMTDYILAEHPDMEPGEVMKVSKAMMEGNRWRLFCLQFSFAGWILLCMLTFGIGSLVLRPYQEAARAAFYREIGAL